MVLVLMISVPGFSSSFWPLAYEVLKTFSISVFP